MKKILASVLLSLCSLVAMADQAASLTKKDADKVINYIKKNGISQLILWCGCCENDPLKKVTVTKIFARNISDEDEYEIIIWGTLPDGTTITQDIDLAYTWIKAGTKANCLGKVLGFDVAPCSAPFDF